MVLKKTISYFRSVKDTLNLCERMLCFGKAFFVWEKIPISNIGTNNHKRKREVISHFPFDLYIDFKHYVFESVGFCVLWVMRHIFLHIFTSHYKSSKIDWLIFYFPTLLIAACAAASLAIGTRNGEQDT